MLVLGSIPDLFFKSDVGSVYLCHKYVICLIIRQFTNIHNFPTQVNHQSNKKQGSFAPCFDLLATFYLLCCLTNCIIRVSQYDSCRFAAKSWSLKRICNNSIDSIITLFSIRSSCLDSYNASISK